MFWRKKLIDTKTLTVSAEVETRPKPSNMTPEEEHAHWLKTRPKYPTSDKDLDAARAAETEWNKKASAIFDAWTSPDPEYRIKQEDAGHYIIQRRKTKRASRDYTAYREDRYGYIYSLYNYRPYYPWADQIEADTDMQAITTYETVKDHTSPRMSYRSGYSKYDHGGSYQNGWNDLMFNVFQDAEDYLTRMVRQPEEKIVGYDYPPLTRR